MEVIEAADYALFFIQGIGAGFVVGFLAVGVCAALSVLKAVTSI